MEKVKFLRVYLILFFNPNPDIVTIFMDLICLLDSSCVIFLLVLLESLELHS